MIEYHINLYLKLIKLNNYNYLLLLKIYIQHNNYKIYNIFKIIIKILYPILFIIILIINLIINLYKIIRIIIKQYFNNIIPYRNFNFKIIKYLDKYSKNRQHHLNIFIKNNLKITMDIVLCHNFILD